MFGEAFKNMSRAERAIALSRFHTEEKRKRDNKRAREESRAAKPADLRNIFKDCVNN